MLTIPLAAEINAQQFGMLVSSSTITCLSNEGEVLINSFFNSQAQNNKI